MRSTTPSNRVFIDYLFFFFTKYIYTYFFYLSFSLCVFNAVLNLEEEGNLSVPGCVIASMLEHALALITIKKNREKSQPAKKKKKGKRWRLVKYIITRSTCQQTQERGPFVFLPFSFQEGNKLAMNFSCSSLNRKITFVSFPFNVKTVNQLLLRAR